MMMASGQARAQSPQWVQRFAKLGCAPGGRILGGSGCESRPRRKFRLLCSVVMDHLARFSPPA